jgi:hypothetical protein
MKCVIDGVTYKRKKEKQGICVGCVAKRTRYGSVTDLCPQLPPCSTPDKEYIWIIHPKQGA